MLSLLAFAALPSLVQSPIVTPYRQSGKLAIESVLPQIRDLSRFQTAEFEIKLTATYDNPFDPSDFSLDMKVTDPRGTVAMVPGFFYRPYSRKLEGGKEVLAAAGDPVWKIRFTPVIEGLHEIVVMAKDRSGATATRPFMIAVSAQAKSQGFVRVSEKDPRFFAFDSGKSYWPLGPNICWGNDKGSFSYDEWLPKYGAQGANYSRLWLSPSWSTFALEQPGKPAEGKGMGQFDLGNAWRLDHVLDLAGKNGMYLMLCIDSYNILRPRDGYPYWENTPHNQDHGGPLRIPRDFWTNEKMEKFYKDKLRYLVARYGASPHTMSWEFWNEVDLTDEFDVERVSDWHRRMASYLRSIDPYKHLITTSTANTGGFRSLDLLPELDYYQTHHYGQDPALTVVVQQSRKGGLGRPHFVGEIGADAGGPRIEDDPTGIQVHDPLWASIATGSSGNASSWWWDNLIAPKELYPIYGAAHRFIEDVDWVNENFRQKTPSLAWQSVPSPRPMRDLEFLSGPAEWVRSPANRAKKVTIRGGKVTSGELPLAGIAHGLGNHPTLHNPVTFDVVLDRPARFEVEVGDVSGYGGGTLAISLDGARMLTREFADPDGDTKTDTLKSFAGKYAITVPKGRHTISATNIGKDWFMVGYRFVGVIPRTKPEVEGWAVIGNTKALAWLRREGRSWRRAIFDKLPASPPSVMALTGLATGKWTVEIWDTWAGKPTSTRTSTVGLDGKVRVNLPPISSDLAIKLKKQ